MNKSRYFYTIYILAVIVFLGASFLFAKQNFGKKSIISPLPNFLTAFSNLQVSTLDLWFPKLKVFNGIMSGINTPDISARSAIVYDLSSERTLYEKSAKDKMPMASLTKIMTAIIAIENSKNSDKYEVAKENLVGEDNMGLSSGEILSLEELIYGMMLHSGNDAAETLATNYPGGRGMFIKAMNDKARSLGLLDTHFTNPTGLEGDGHQYTTAYDLVVITRYAIRSSLFAKITATFDYNIPYTSGHKAFYLENETNLLTSYPGVLGVKTGYTPEAGLCLVTYLNYKGHKIIGVLLGSDNRRQEMKDLLDYSLKIQGVKPPPHG